MGRLLDEDDIIKELNEYASIWMEYYADMTQEEVAEAALNAAKRTMVHILEEMPSALPEIIRCKDCMHNGSYDTDCPIDWNGKEYCSYAERREELA